ncbi:MAG TPA: hypothetical protein VE465_17205 [Streptosporangiaceae bacterium]|jgi:hypothetical protein|nr:hypothetical protein [Streptosporangiaceae bacterium]
MSKCQTVQDELKINELAVRKKKDGKRIERKVLPARKEQKAHK